MVTVAGEPQYGVFHINPAASDPWIQNDKDILSAPLDYDTLEVTMAVASKVSTAEQDFRSRYFDRVQCSQEG